MVKNQIYFNYIIHTSIDSSVKPIYQIINQSIINQLINQSIYKIINQSIDRSNNQSINQIIVLYINHSINYNKTIKLSIIYTQQQLNSLHLTVPRNQRLKSTSMFIQECFLDEWIQLFRFKAS